MTTHRVGIFDSGVGGLSVLAAVRARLPAATIHYIADSGHAPYGERSDAHVLARSQSIAARLVGEGAQALVIACNTATAIAANSLREDWPQLPIIGIEPGIKPALAASRNRRIGVMATQATLRSARFERLLAAYRGDSSVVLQACTGLAAAIEGGRLGNPILRALVTHHCQAMLQAGVDTIVLGCTHYVFARALIQAAVGADVLLIDTADAVARQVAAVCSTLPPTNALPFEAITRLETSGDAEALRRIATQWLGIDVEPSALLDAVP